MQPRINRCIRWLCAPDEISTLMAFGFYTVTTLLFGFMVAYYYGVVNDNRFINDNLMFRMSQESESFMKNINDSVCAIQFLKEYQWLKKFHALIHENCHITPTNLKTLRYTGYILAAYNTFLMHILLSGILPVSALPCLPIVKSFISGYINPSNLIILGLFEFGQTALSLAIMITFIFLKERQKNLYWLYRAI